jgi:hypothetical protein
MSRDTARSKTLQKSTVLWPAEDAPEWAPEWMVTLLWDEIDGRMECVGVEVRSDANAPVSPPLRPQPLTTALVRSIPLGQLIADERRRLAGVWDEVAALPHPEGAPLPLGSARYRKRAESFRAGKRRDYGDDHYRAVAEVYAAAWRRGEPPTRAVQEWASDVYGSVSRSAAANWVATCRTMGLLAPTEQRRAGGVPSIDGEDKP